MAVKQEMMEILACPKCKGEVVLKQELNGLVCEKCGLLYEIRDDIPVMISDTAKKI
ncbi:MAG: Trm112 family protein [Syntrophaceae bacterium]